MQDKTLNFEQALNIANQAVFITVGRYLTDVETAIFRGAWLHQTYEEMSANTEYTVNYLQRTVGHKFWKLLSEALGEEVSKSNFRTAIERKLVATGPTQSPAAISLEFPEGPVELDSTFYVERSPIESDCCKAILTPGALIRIKASRQMGKTSLLNRILNSAVQAGYRTVNLNLLLADRGVLKSLDQFLRWFCKCVSRELQLPNKLAEYWDEEIFTSNTNCTNYFEDYLLSEIDTPLVLGLDEVDRIFPYAEIAQDFFGLLRVLHEYAKLKDSIWKKLRLVIVHSTDVYIPLKVNQSPFNVGLPIELPEFTTQQVQDLAERYGLNCDTNTGSQLAPLMAMVGGHPYLVQLAIYHLRRQNLTLEQLLQTAPTDVGIYREHLQGHWGTIQEYPQLATAFKQVVNAKDTVQLESMLQFKLLSIGLVKQQQNGVIPSCELYRQYFQHKFGDNI
ncbi:MAG TPA: AAA-like domain-containing protein [Kamptonema sp.]|nr:AAA-like domain-containing protein [Kamptonema sp.]